MPSSIPRVAILLGSLALSSLSAAASIPADRGALETRRPAAAAAAAERAGLSVTDNHHTLSRTKRPPGLLRTVDMLRQNQKSTSSPQDKDNVYDPEGVGGLQTELNQVSTWNNPPPPPPPPSTFPPLLLVVLLSL